MKILALEFSCDERSVAVLDTVHGETREMVESGGRSVKAISLIDAALQQARIEREEIESIAVGLGPGSYTGIRAAIAIAQGWQLARDVKLLGFGACAALVAQAKVAGIHGTVNIVIDAQRGEFYVATFCVSNSDARELAPLRLATRPEIQARIEAGEVVAGPDATRWFSSGRVLIPRAAALAELAASQTEFVAGETLEPIYLRETSFVKAPAPRLV
ncbi:MAG: tRNA (adenosine(37)-N6)-threonylcarbamoyltransferase complex dimerization subunit type 1 TsaB [Verrucomicrobia bacterium]|nr:tRNA (adenosine(37)-N6)-threonylcarbamoyltransferase complex dimerization subunit type 1 TsaB [Verrucomicrobiota bacterium]